MSCFGQLHQGVGDYLAGLLFFKFDTDGTKMNDPAALLSGVEGLHLCLLFVCHRFHLKLHSLSLPQ